jgi:hypothetical protein
MQGRARDRDALSPEHLPDLRQPQTALQPALVERANRTAGPERATRVEGVHRAEPTPPGTPVGCTPGRVAVCPGFSVLVRCFVCAGRGVAQPGRALGSGPRGRWFKSSRPDQTTPTRLPRWGPRHEDVAHWPGLPGLFAVRLCAGCPRTWWSRSGPWTNPGQICRRRGTLAEQDSVYKQGLRPKRKGTKAVAAEAGFYPTDVVGAENATQAAMAKMESLAAEYLHRLRAGEILTTDRGGRRVRRRGAPLPHKSAPAAARVSPIAIRPIAAAH